MPVISRFYGMVVKMYFAAVVSAGSTTAGRRNLREWAGQHKAELRRIWDTQQFQSIPPLV